MKSKIVNMLNAGSADAPESFTLAVGSKDMRGAVTHLMEFFGMVLPEGKEVTDDSVQVLFLGRTQIKVKRFDGEEKVLETLLSFCHLSLVVQTLPNYASLGQWLRTKGFFANDSDINRERSYARFTHRDHLYSVHIAYRKTRPVRPSVDS